MKHALIIEDNVEIGNIYCMTLEMLEYETEHFTDGKAALDRLGEVEPDLIVLDMNLPQISGHYIYKKVRSEPRMNKTTIIISTANNLVAEVLAGELAPGDHLLLKPVSMQELRKLAGGNSKSS